MFEIYIALITPFKKDFSIDYKALEKLIYYYISIGVKGFVVCGTTGETPTLLNEEKIKILDFVSNLCGDDIKIFYGCGGNDTKRTLQQIQSVENKKINGLLLVTPYYNRPSQKGLYAHFSYLAKHAKHNIMLYNVPHRCGVNLENDTIVSLIKNHKNITSLKQASLDFSIVDLCKKIRPDFKIYSGEDAYISEAFEHQMDGMISVMGHINYERMIQFVNGGCCDEILCKQLKKEAVLLFKDASPNGIKYILYKKGWIENILRLPMVALSDEKIIKEMNRQFL